MKKGNIIAVIAVAVVVLASLFFFGPLGKMFV